MSKKITLTIDVEKLRMSDGKKKLVNLRVDEDRARAAVVRVADNQCVSLQRRVKAEEVSGSEAGQRPLLLDGN